MRTRSGVLFSNFVNVIVCYHNNKKRTLLFSFGIYLIVAGAISNLIDRILFTITIDYFRIVTSIINLADVMIVVGAGMLIFVEMKKKKK